MKNISTVVVCSVVLASGYGCSSATDERSATTAQRIETGDASGSESTNAGSAPGVCEHALCATGGPLQAACDPCATNLCALDPYCCSVAWDATCVGEVGAICGSSCN